jgi:Mn-dependent DtxR family transcriptional regulator
MKYHNWEKEVISFIKKEGVIMSSELAEQMKISWNTAEKYLLELALGGKVKRIKKKGANLWVLK